MPGVRIEGVLGRGASSIVYLGTQERFGRKVAVKVLHPTLDDAGERLFRTECSTLGRFASHPNILTLFDAGFLESGSPYLVTEYLPAGTMADRLAAEGPMPWSEAVAIGVQLAGALESTHHEGVVHGDIKPHNVLLGRMGQPVLGDFGIARASVGASVSTVSAVTPLYAAPELFGQVEPSPSSDIYALAATLFELVDGTPAVGSSEDSPLVVVRRIADGERRALAQRLAPVELCELLDRSMDELPEHRPASAADLGEALRSLQLREGLDQTPMPVMAPLEDHPELIDLTGKAALPSRITLGLPERRRPRWLLPVGVAVLAVLAALAWLLPRAGGREEVGAGSGTSLVASTSSTTSTTLPTETTAVAGSKVAGIQPGVELVHGAADASPGLADALREESLIFLSLAPRSTEVVSRPVYGAMLTGLPARFRYQGFNPASPDTCRGMMTRDLQVDGLWERGVLWPGGRVQVAVGRLAAEEEAHELFTALSLAVGVKKSGCDGMGTFGPADFGRTYSVVQRDLLLTDYLVPSVTYNSWVSANGTFDGVTYPFEVRVVVEAGADVVDLALFDDGTFPVPREQALGSILTQILGRL